MESCPRDESPTNLRPTPPTNRTRENPARDKRIGTPANTIVPENIIRDPAFGRIEQTPTDRRQSQLLAEIASLIFCLLAASAFRIIPQPSVAAIVPRSNHCDKEESAFVAASILEPAKEISAMPTDSPNHKNKNRRVAPAKFAHAVLATKQLEPMIDFYTTVLAAEVVHRNEMLAFRTYDDEHHRIALAAIPGLVDKPRHSVGLDHLAYTYANLGDLVFTYERLKQAGILPIATINHGPTTSLYYRDPDGNRVELQIDNFETVEELKGFFKSDAMRKNPIGVSFDADQLARDYHAGVPEAELKKYDPSKGIDPETMRRLVANQHERTTSK